MEFALSETRDGKIGCLQIRLSKNKGNNEALNRRRWTRIKGKYRDEKNKNNKANSKRKKEKMQMLRRRQRKGREVKKISKESQ